MFVNLKKKEKTLVTEVAKKIMFENSSSNSRVNCYKPYFNPVLLEIVLYSIMVVIGTIGNVMTCVVIGNNKFMHTATNCYLFNLAVSDVIILYSNFPLLHSIPLHTDINMQIKVSFWKNLDFSSYSLLNLASNYSRILTARTSVNVTVLTVSVLSVERYVAICHSFLASKCNLSSTSRPMKSISVIWLVGLVTALPLTLQFGLGPQIGNPSLKTCTYVNKMNLYYVPGLILIFFCIIPIVLIGTLYVIIGLKIKESTKTIKSNNESVERLKERAPKMLSK